MFQKVDMEKKSLLENSIYNVAYKLLNILFPLLSASYVSYALLASGVGKVASAQNIVQYFVIIAALGIPNYGVRETALVKKNSGELNRFFSELFIINFISTVLCCIAYYTLISSLTFFENEKMLYMICGMSIFLNIINVDWFYQGIEQFKYIALRSFIVKICLLVLIFVLVKNKNDYVLYAFLSVLATTGNNIFNIKNLKKHGIKLKFFHLHFYKHLKPVMILLCTAISVELYTLLDTTMLTVMCAEENVGYYTNSMKIVKMLITAITGISGVLLPRLSMYQKEGKFDECGNIVSKVFSILLFVFLPCGIGIILVSSSLVTVLFGSSFTPAVVTLRIASLLIYVLGFSNLFGTQVLLTFNCEKKLLLCTIIGAVSNITMNLILIPIFEQNGAAIASVISELFVTVLAVHYSKKYISIQVDKRFLFSCIISTLIMALIVRFINQIVDSNVMCLFVAVISGGIAYVVLNYVLKNPILIELMEIITKKIKMR